MVRIYRYGSNSIPKAKKDTVNTQRVVVCRKKTSTEAIHSTIEIEIYRFIADVLHPAVEIGRLPDQRCNVLRGGQIKAWPTIERRPP